ncbi:MAG: hypothetical protein ACOYM7_05540 [Paludibacter sp.]
MTITQEPASNTLYFQKSVPDIILNKTTNDTFVLFQLLKGATVILTENYTYDADGVIHIRNIFEVTEKYLSVEHLLEFSYSITEGVTVHTVNFSVLKCESALALDAADWTSKNFLTRAYREKRTAKARNEYLSFLQKNSYGTVTKHFKVYYVLDNVLTELVGTLGTIAAATTDKITTFSPSISALVTAAGLTGEAKLLQYDIWATGTGFKIAKYSFLVDNMPYRHTTSFYFVNSFGVMETFTATGMTDVKKTAEYNLANIQRHYRKITQNFLAEKTINSGYLSATEMEWIDDLILSYDVRIYTASGLEEIALTTVAKKDTEANELQAFSFSYRSAKNNHLQFANADKGIFDETFDETFN